MTVKKIFTLVLLIVSISCLPQEPIEYHHKLVGRQLKKTFDLNDFNLTEISVEDSLKSMFQGKYYQVSDNVSQQGYCYIGRVKSCRAGGCSISKRDDKDLSFEYFDYIVIFDTNKTVRSVRVLNYRATHGHEVCSRGWLKQFEGYSGNKQLEVGKDIDAISGATISVYAITVDIEKVQYFLEEVDR